MEKKVNKDDKRFVDLMIKKAEESKKIKPESKADLSEIEKITDNIRRKIQRGEK